jgi:hypothetical protein
MTNWKDIPMPGNIKLLKRDKRGYPVPYTVLVDKKGTAYFKVNDDRKAFAAIMSKLCIICGKPMDKDMWFIGGPKSAFHPAGAFNDSPVHHLCGTYAFQVCPYMNQSDYTKNPVDYDKLNNKLGEKFQYADNSEKSGNRHLLFVFAKVSNFNFTMSMQTGLLFKPVRPYLELEYWNHGEQLDKDEAEKLIFEKTGLKPTL